MAPVPGAGNDRAWPASTRMEAKMKRYRNSMAQPQESDRNRCSVGKLVIATLLLAGASMPGLAADDVAGTRPPIVGILQDTEEHFRENLASGMQAIVLELGWDQAEPREGRFQSSYFAAKRARMEKYRSDGMLIALDLGFQYPPAWIFRLPHARYVNQYGDVFESTTIGENVPNAVFSQAVRDRQEDYLQHVFEQLGSDFLLVRLGWMKYGELAYPLHAFRDRRNCYWSYDDLAQGRAAGLAAGLTPCPVEDWRPGEPSPIHGRARAFIEWHLGALENYHDWQIRTARKYTNAPLAMLYPSWGMRPGVLEKAIQGDLGGRTSSEINGEIQRGLDFERLISGIRDPNLIVYCTWVDSSPAFSQDDLSDPAGWSPARYLSSLATEHQPTLALWAENTGGGDMATLGLTRQRLQQFGYQGFFWAFERDLYDGKPPEITHFGEFARTLRAR